MRKLHLSLGFLFACLTLCYPLSVLCEEARTNPSERRFLIIEAAKRSLEERKPFVLLRQLSLIEGDLVDVEVQRMVEKSLEQLVENIEQVESMEETHSALEDIGVQYLLDFAILNNPELEKQYLKILAARAVSLAQIGNLAQLKIIYDQIVNRSEPGSEFRDELSLKIIKEATGDVKLTLAVELIADLKERDVLSRSDYFSLFMRGYYFGGIVGRTIIILSVFLLLVGILYLIVFVVWRPSVLKSKKVSRIFDHSRVPTAEELVSDDDEYSRHLTVLGLTDSASDDEIRQTYRRLIKELHPDASKGPEDPEALKRFRMVQYAYKRIKEMNEGRFS